jgi:superfamily I DNA/RNA helicase
MVNWTNEQNDIFNFTLESSQNGVFEAVAGSGKTSTIIEAAKHFKAANPTKTVRFTAFGNKIAAEIRRKTEGSSVEVTTSHALGYQAWKQVAPNCKLLGGTGKGGAGLFDRAKISDTTVYKGFTFDEKIELSQFVEALVEKAKNSGVVILWEVENRSKYWELVRKFDLAYLIGSNPWNPGTDDQVEDGITFAIRTIKEHIRLAYDYMGFVDQLWFPLVFKVLIPKVDLVFGDEAQDFNALQQILLKLQGHRIIAVGDSQQAIFGFTGSDNESLGNLAKQLNATVLGLTYCFRCPLVAIRYAQQYNPRIQAHPAAIEGEEYSLTYKELLASADKLVSTDAILCRKTAPLVELAYTLISRGIACHVEGRDIGKSLIKFVTKWKRVKTIQDLFDKLDEYSAKQIASLTAKGQETQAASLDDKCETLKVIADSLDPSDSIDTLKVKIESIFADDQPNVTLSTIHKAKGREWDRVFWLGQAAYQPSKFARQDWQLEQEDNLCYVAATRTKHTLVHVSAKPKDKD